MDELEELRRALEGASIRLTHQRMEIYKEIKSARDHPSVEVLYERLRPRLPTISLDTVYRTLTMFVELGLVKRVYGKDPVARYDPDTSCHHHMICKECGAIIDFDWPDVSELPIPDNVRHLGQIEYMQVQLVGTCKKCQKKGGKKR